MAKEAKRDYPVSETTSTTLIQQLKSGDNESWSFFVFVYRPMIRNWAIRSGASPNEAEEVENEVVASVLHSLESFQKGERTGSFRAWLKTITHRRTIDFLRKRGAPADGGTQALDNIKQIAQPTDESIESVPEDDRKVELHRALAYWKNRVKPHTYQAFHRVVVEGQEPQDVARDLQIDIQVVYQACSRMLTRLRSHLGEDFVRPS